MKKDKNNKIVLDKTDKILSMILLGILPTCILTASGIFIYPKDDQKSMDGKLDIVVREYDPDIVFNAPNSDASVSITTYNDYAGMTGSELESFFVNDYDVEDSYGNHFVELKKFYIFMEQDSEGVLTYKLSHEQLNEDYFVCPYFYNKDGNEIDYAYYGKYKGYVEEEKLYSKSGVVPTTKGG